MTGHLVLGALGFGTRVDESASMALLDRFVEAGGTWIDTANCYSWWLDRSGVGGQSERVIGRWLAARPGLRDRVRISTKVGQEPLVPHRWPESAEGLSAAAIRAAVRASLDRLGTDRIDLCWAHAEDRTVALAETVEAFGELVEAGAVARLGASNHATWRVERARQLAGARGIAGYTAIQLRYSYLQPRPGVSLPESAHVHASPETLDYVRSEPELSLWAYSTLLNGGYTRADRPLFEGYDHPGTTRRLAALTAVAEQLGATRNQVVLAWLTGGDPVIAPIVGITTAAQLEEALGAADLKLSGEQRHHLDEAG